MRITRFQWICAAQSEKTRKQRVLHDFIHRPTRSFVDNDLIDDLKDSDWLIFAHYANYNIFRKLAPFLQSLHCKLQCFAWLRRGTTVLLAIYLYLQAS